MEGDFIMARKVKDNVKFSNVDILQFMGQIVQKHMQCYQSDFEIDKEILKEAAGNKEQQDRTFIWLCRTHGTWLLNERDVFLKDTREYNTFNFYLEQTSEPVLVFAVEVTGACNGTVYGNLYAMDYEMLYRHVKTSALDAECVMVGYENGIRTRGINAAISGSPDEEYGEFQYLQFQPRSQEELAGLLYMERQERGHFLECNLAAYIANL